MSTRTSSTTARGSIPRARRGSPSPAEVAAAAENQVRERMVAKAPEALRDRMSGSTSLRAFLTTAGTLTRAERLLLVDQALVLLEQNYVHLPLKAAMHAVNPVQRLRVLRARVLREPEDAATPEWAFHAEMSEIFHSVRDLHTNYLLPAPFAGKVAYLPFQVERFLDDGQERFVVSRLVAGFSAPGFKPGAEVTHWSGIPVATAVDLNAARFAGSNTAARRSRGLESLTIRPLRMHLPPYEEWVAVSYVDLDGVARELRQEWLVVDNLPAFADLDTVSVTATSAGLDLDTDETSRARALLFAPQAVAEQAGTDAVPAAPSVAAGEVSSTMPSVFRARVVTTSSGTFGHLRVFTFAVQDPAAFVGELVRLAGLLPQDGLILDVRGNGGGHIHASELSLQTLTPRRITPEPVQFLSSPLNLRLVRKHKDDPTGQIDLGPWFPSLEQATETGATYSGAFPITPEEGANSIGQQYFGPVVLVTDARCYSATDIFAAGFQDHGIGPVLGTDDNTGAGGANVWTLGLLKALLDSPVPEPDSPYRDLPGGAGMRVSIRRTLRVGPAAGTPVEDLGVVPDERHALTRADVLSGNADLLEHAGALLAARPVRRLDVAATRTGADLELTVALSGVDRVDVYTDGRPRASADVSGPSLQVTVHGAGAAETIRVEGFVGSELVAARTVVP